VRTRERLMLEAEALWSGKTGMRGRNWLLSNGCGEGERAREGAADTRSGSFVPGLAGVRPPWRGIFEKE